MITASAAMVEARRLRWAALEAGSHDPLDVLVIGGGISGAPVFAELARAGMRVGLVERGDFAGGTSQASGMLVWGGLLYLKHGDLRTVRKLCLARNELLREPEVRPLQFRYPTAYAGGLPSAALMAGLWFYWLLGDRALRYPELLNAGTPEEAVAYEEAMLGESDSRLVLRFLREGEALGGTALNYSEVVHARFDAGERLWRVGLRDGVTGEERELRTRLLVNAAGVWADGVNALAGIESPYRHLLSKGVYLNLKRPDDRDYASIYPMPGASDVLTYVPWGPVMMWGPTETPVEEISRALQPEEEDVSYLLRSAEQLWGREVPLEEVVSIRCGIRPLAVKEGAKIRGGSLAVSRRHYLAIDREHPAMVIYGGKLTGSAALGREVAERVAEVLPGRRESRLVPDAPEPEMICHPAFSQPVVSPEWARDREQCFSLRDYLRRRTPIAQWVPHMGLGERDEGRAQLREWAALFAGSDAGAEAMLAEVEHEVCRTREILLHSRP